MNSRTEHQHGGTFNCNKNFCANQQNHNAQRTDVCTDNQDKHTHHKNRYANI
jgi:hypothetical protein